MRTTIHLIRHADATPEADRELRATATYDELGLSAVGIRQVNALARRLAASRRAPAAVYASPTQRARDTAAVLARALAVDVTVDDGLREIYLGPISAGHVPLTERPEHIRARLAELAAIAQRDGSWNAVANAEPAHDVRARMSTTIAAIVADHPGRHVALVSHAGTINAYIAGIIGTPRDFFFLAGNTSLNSITFVDGIPLLVRLNDTAHLEATAAGAIEF